MTTTAYDRVWDSYWTNLPGGIGQALWDGDPSVSVPRRLLAEHFDAALPVIDVGCGNGTQTAALAAQFLKVIGLDVSQAALDHARDSHSGLGIDFRRLDVLAPDRAVELHAQVGDANVYARGLLHLFTPAERATVISSFAALNGNQGRVFSYEPAPAAGELLAELVSQSGGPPPKVARILEHGIHPADLGEGETESLLANAGYTIDAAGSILWPSTQVLADGVTALEIPMRYVAARPGR